MRLTGEELDIGAVGYALDHAAHFFRLSAVDSARGGESCEPLAALPILADLEGRMPLDPEEAALRDAPEILPQSRAVFEPRDHGHVAEAPCFHDLEPVREEVIRHPEIQVTVLRRDARDVQCHNVFGTHERVVTISSPLDPAPPRSLSTGDRRKWSRIS